VDPNAAAGQPAVVTGATNIVTLVCRAVDLSKTGVSLGNNEVAFAVQNEINASALVNTNATQLVGQIVQDDATGTFTFTINVVPLNPLNF
jgi:hypothetical protein